MDLPLPETVEDLGYYHANMQKPMLMGIIRAARQALQDDRISHRERMTLAIYAGQAILAIMALVTEQDEALREAIFAAWESGVLVPPPAQEPEA